MVIAPPPSWIGRQAAQQLARRELSKPIYHQGPPPAERILLAVARWLARLQHLASKAPGGWWGVIALAVIAVVVIAAVRAWMGPVARSHRGRRALATSERARSARDHRQDAQRLAEAGDFAGAIREALRAIAAELGERGVAPPRPGRTADEFAHEAGLVLPGLAAALRDAAAAFDEVCYGARPGDAAGYERLRQLDSAVRASAPRAAPADEAALAGVGGRRSWP